MNEPKKIPLCKDCTFFIHVNAACGRALREPDYVFGITPVNWSAQAERTSKVEKDCGPEALYFLPIALATPDYAETMIRKDKEKRHVGCSEDDMDIACRKLQAGS